MEAQPAYHAWAYKQRHFCPWFGSPSWRCPYWKNCQLRPTELLHVDTHLEEKSFSNTKFQILIEWETKDIKTNFWKTNIDDFWGNHEVNSSNSIFGYECLLVCKMSVIVLNCAIALNDLNFFFDSGQMAMPRKMHAYVYTIPSPCW